MEFIDDFTNHNSLANPANGSADNGFANDDWLDMALGIGGPQDDWLLGLENSDCPGLFGDDKHNKLAEKAGLGKASMLRTAFSTGDLQSLQHSSDYSPSWAQLNQQSAGRLESVPENCTTNGGPLGLFTSASSSINKPSPQFQPIKAPSPATSPAAPSPSDPLESLTIEQLEAQLSLAQQELAVNPAHFDPSSNPFLDPLSITFPPGSPSPSGGSSSTAPPAPSIPPTTSLPLPQVPIIKQSASAQDLASLAANNQANGGMQAPPQPFAPSSSMAAGAAAPPPLPFMLQGHNNLAMGPQVQFNTLLRPMPSQPGPGLPTLPSHPPQLQPPSLPSLMRPQQQQPGLPSQQQAQSMQQHQQQQKNHHPQQQHPLSLHTPLSSLSLPTPPGQQQQQHRQHQPDGHPSSSGGMPAASQQLPGFSQPLGFSLPSDPSSSSMPMDFSQPLRPPLPIFPALPQPSYPDLSRPPHSPHSLHHHNPHHHHSHNHHHPASPLSALPSPGAPPSPPDHFHSILPRPLGGLRKSQSAMELASWRSASSLDLTDLANAAKIPVGKLSQEERAQKILRYREKRNARNFNRTIKYQCRKTLADTRPRVRGRFARNNDPESVPPELTKKALRERAKGDVVGVKCEGGDGGSDEMVVVMVGATGVPAAAAGGGGGGSGSGGAGACAQQSSSGCTATSTDDSLELPSFSDPMAMLVDSTASSPFNYLATASSAPNPPPQPMVMQQHQMYPTYPPFMAPNQSS